MKIAKTILIFALIISICFIVSCEKDKNSEIPVEPKKWLESGLDGPPDGDPAPTICFGYKTSGREYDVDNFEVEIYFGWLGLSNNGKNYNNSIFELIVRNNSNVDKFIVIKEIQDFNSIDYKCGYTTNDAGNRVFTYNHHETIKVPKELLIGEEGLVAISIRPKTNGSVGYGGNGDDIMYRKIDENTIRVFSLGYWYTKGTKDEEKHK